MTYSILIYKDNLSLFNLNENSEYRKIFSFQICFMLNQSKAFAYTLQAEKAV